MSKLPTYKELIIFVSQLQGQVLELEKLYPTIQKLEKEIKVLKRENTVLKNKLAKYENPKNSSNSSIPPSKDENRPFKSNSLRKKTGRKPGGQKGHEGMTLEMVSHPDEIIDHVPDYCKCCGKNISTIPKEFVDRKQIIDLPPIEPVITEHRVYQRKCSCSNVTTIFFS